MPVNQFINNTTCSWGGNQRLNCHEGRTIRMILDPRSGLRELSQRGDSLVNSDFVDVDFITTITHESGHAYQFLTSAKRTHQLISNTDVDPELSNAAEEEIIKGPENRLRKNRGMPIRKSYRYGFHFRTNEVTSRQAITWNKELRRQGRGISR
jgi:hypothetical protein